MAQGSITNLHIARVKGTPSDPVQEANAISGLDLEGDRSADEGNQRQVLLDDNKILDDAGLNPGQIKENITVSGLDLSDAKIGQVFSIGNAVTLEVVGDCEACSKMDAIRMGLKDSLDGKRGTLAKVLNGGAIKIGDTISIA